MLSHEQKSFVETFRNELIKKEKHPEFIEEQEKSLIQQLEYQNEIGQDTTQFGGGPVQYANTVARELPRAHDFIKLILMTFTFILGVMVIPQFLNDTVTLSLGHLMYVILIVGFGAFGFYTILRIVELRFVDYHKNKVSMIAYLLIFGFVMLLAGAYLVAGDYFDANPIMIFAEFSSETNIIIGWVLLAIFTLFLFAFRYWLFAVLLVVFSVAPVIYRNFTNAPIDGDNYLILSNIVFQLVILAAVTLIGIIAWANSKRRSKTTK